ncbi:MAG TPA: FAD-binding oxidoreductase [Thermoanaerobaculia bacterium]
MTAPSGRAATAGDAILGVAPAVVYDPASPEEAAAVIKETALEHKSLAFVGGATDIDLGPPPSRLDAVVKTGRLSRVLEHAPSDQIVVVEAGATLAALQEALAPHGQQLALDPPLPGRATVGGILAANAFGPRRARYGSVRDLVIGLSLVRADGTLARGGSKVVKNVAGLDLPKLLVGSLGTLGLIVSTTFRLHPLPEDSATILAPGRDAKSVRALVAKIRDAQLEPTSVVAIWREGAFDVGVRFEGFRAGVADQRDRLLALQGNGGAQACESLDAAAAKAFWERHDTLRVEGTLRAKLTALPNAIEEIAEDLLPPLLSVLERPGFLWYATLGLGFVSGDVGSPESAASAIDRTRRLLARSDGSLTLSAAPGSLRAHVDVWGPAPSSLALMKSVKERLDPDRRLNPGRFVGGI